jgi:acetyl-CoA carboxylase carboxyl transferase subunit beta
LQQDQVRENREVCSECGHHFRTSAKRRIELVCDAGSFVEHDANLDATDFLEFFDSKSYKSRLEASKKKTGLKDAFVAGEAKLGGRAIQIGSFEFAFMGGSMGTIVGEKISRLFERALEKNNLQLFFNRVEALVCKRGFLRSCKWLKH